MTLERTALVFLALTVPLGATSCEESRAVKEPSGASEPSASSPSPKTKSGPLQATEQRDVDFIGMCDASGAIALGGHHFAVVDDEDDTLRVYDGDRGGWPLRKVELSTALGYGQSRRVESDFEAMSRRGDAAYILASHGRTRQGNLDGERVIFISLSVAGEDFTLRGDPYVGLLRDMEAEPKLAELGLTAAAAKPTGAPGGLNLEGLAALSDGSLAIGFRSPTLEGKAIVVRLLNPEEVLHGKRGRFAQPETVPFGGLGIRSLTRYDSMLLAIAGPQGDGGPFGLFQVDLPSWAPVPIHVSLANLGPEALVLFDDRRSALVLSDDGTRIVNGSVCKTMKRPHVKRFRGRWLSLRR